jgi:hypothetical protein
LLDRPDRPGATVGTAAMDDRDRTRAVTITEAAHLLGKTPDAVRGLIRRGTLTAISGNDGHRRVLLSDAQATVETVATVQSHNDRAQSSPAQATVELTGLLVDLRDILLRTRQERDRARTDVERWRAEAEQARAATIRAVADREAARAVAVAEVEAAKRVAVAEIAAAQAAHAQVVQELRAQVAREIARSDALAAELRRPWWRKLLGS